MNVYPASPETGLPRVAVSTVINDLIVQNGVAAAKERAQEVDAFISTTASANVIVVDVLKGMLANRQA